MTESQKPDPKNKPCGQSTKNTPKGSGLCSTPADGSTKQTRAYTPPAAGKKLQKTHFNKHTNSFKLS
jgi:hypothetical protein